MTTSPRIPTRTIRPLLSYWPPGEIAITDLPFVKDKKDGGRSFWHVKPTGRYADDCLIGKQYALEAIHYMRSQGAPFLLGWIALDMPRRGDSTGIEVGFMHEIACRI